MYSRVHSAHRINLLTVIKTHSCRYTVTEDKIIVVGIFAAPLIPKRKNGPTRIRDRCKGKPYGMNIRVRGNSGGLATKHTAKSRPHNTHHHRTLTIPFEYHFDLNAADPTGYMTKRDPSVLAEHCSLMGS